MGGGVGIFVEDFTEYLDYIASNYSCSTKLLYQTEYFIKSLSIEDYKLTYLRKKIMKKGL